MAGSQGKWLPLMLESPLLSPPFWFLYLVEVSDLWYRTNKCVCKKAQQWTQLCSTLPSQYVLPAMATASWAWTTHENCKSILTQKYSYCRKSWMEEPPLRAKYLLVFLTGCWQCFFSSPFLPILSSSSPPLLFFFPFIPSSPITSTLRTDKCHQIWTHFMQHIMACYYTCYHFFYLIKKTNLYFYFLLHIEHILL